VRWHWGGEKGGDDASWADANLPGPKNEKNHAIDSADINGFKTHAMLRHFKISFSVNSHADKLFEK
jgi:hypothetical protein